MKIEMFRADDWGVMFVDGELADSGHEVAGGAATNVLDALGIEYEYKDLLDDDIDENVDVDALLMNPSIEELRAL